ncbi:MAG: hypothetical protein AAGF11_42735 [Myxococcota bacterium]
MISFNSGLNGRSLGLALAGMLALAGCPGDDGGDDTDGATTMPTTTMSPGSESGSDTMAPADSSTGGGSGGVHDAMIQPIWDAACASATCHAAAVVFPDLSPGAAYASIVGVMSQQVDMPLITASDPDNSYLWRKLEGTHTEVMLSSGDMNMTAPMPLVDMGNFSMGDRDTIMMWIQDGAME